MNDFILRLKILSVMLMGAVFTNTLQTVLEKIIDMIVRGH